MRTIPLPGEQRRRRRRLNDPWPGTLAVWRLATTRTAAGTRNGASATAPAAQVSRTTLDRPISKSPSRSLLRQRSTPRRQGQLIGNGLIFCCFIASDSSVLPRLFFSTPTRQETTFSETGCFPNKRKIGKLPEFYPVTSWLFIIYRVRRYMFCQGNFVTCYGFYHTFAVFSFLSRMGLLFSLCINLYILCVWLLSWINLVHNCFSSYSSFTPCYISCFFILFSRLLEPQCGPCREVPVAVL